MRHPLPASQRDNTAGETPHSTCGGGRGEGGSCGEVVVVKTTSAAGSGHRGGAGNAGPFSSGRRPNVPHATRRAPRRLHRCPTGDPAPGSCRRSRTQARAAVPRRPSQLPVEAAVAPRSTLLRREYGAGCRHNPHRVPAGGARKVAAGGGAQGGRDLGLRRAIGSARAHRAEELAVDKKACKVGGLTVE